MGQPSGNLRVGKVVESGNWQVWIFVSLENRVWKMTVWKTAVGKKTWRQQLGLANKLPLIIQVVFAVLRMFLNRRYVRRTFQTLACEGTTEGEACHSLLTGAWHSDFLFDSNLSRLVLSSISKPKGDPSSLKWYI
jgi:hypothetical protein